MKLNAESLSDYFEQLWKWCCHPPMFQIEIDECQEFCTEFMADILETYPDYMVPEKVGEIINQLLRPLVRRALEMQKQHTLSAQFASQMIDAHQAIMPHAMPIEPAPITMKYVSAALH